MYLFLWLYEDVVLRMTALTGIGKSSFPEHLIQTPLAQIYRLAAGFRALLHFALRTLRPWIFRAFSLDIIGRLMRGKGL